MSLTISITTPYGIVLAADSRQTMTLFNQTVQIPRIGSDSATKVFSVPGKSIGITVAGPAFLPDLKNPQTQRSIGSFINDYLKDLPQDVTVESVHDGLVKYLNGIYTEVQFEQMEKGIRADIERQGGTFLKAERLENNTRLALHFKTPDNKVGRAEAQLMQISLIVAGYDLVKDGKNEQFHLSNYVSYIPGQTSIKRKANAPDQYGCSWTGQTELVQRVIKGFDPRIPGSAAMGQFVQQIGEEVFKEQLAPLEYQINWAAMTLQDAIELAQLLIDTTAAIQRFSVGTGFGPDFPGVGGPVDIAVILPELDGFRWHAKKPLTLMKPQEVTQV